VLVVREPMFKAVDISRVNGVKIGLRHSSDPFLNAIVEAIQTHFETYPHRRENFGTFLLPQAWQRGHRAADAKHPPGPPSPLCELTAGESHGSRPTAATNRSTCAGRCARLTKHFWACRPRQDTDRVACSVCLKEAAMLPLRGAGNIGWGNRSEHAPGMPH
jgi:hypothetical protein